jgi:hypothetical protein
MTLEKYEIKWLISANGKQAFKAKITLAVSGYFGI